MRANTIGPEILITGGIVVNPHINTYSNEATIEKMFSILTLS